MIKCFELSTCNGGIDGTLRMYNVGGKWNFRKISGKVITFFNKMRITV